MAGKKKDIGEQPVLKVDFFEGMSDSDIASREEVTEEATEEMVVAEDVTPEPETFTIVLVGPVNQMLDYGVNGVFSKLPCGVELVVNRQVYDAVKGHIK